MGFHGPRAVLVAAIMAGAIGGGPAAAASPIEDLVVAPPGAEVVRAEDIGVDVPPGTASFLDAYEDLDVVVVEVDTALVRRGEERLMATTVRLAAPAQAEQAWDAVLAPHDEVEIGAPLAPGVGYRQSAHDEYVIHEAVRVVGADLVVWADLAFGAEPSALLREAVEAHLAAHPDAAPRAAVPFVAGGVGALVVVGGLVLRRSTRSRPRLATGVATPAPPEGGPTAPVGRVNW